MGQHVLSLLCACLICAVAAAVMPEGYRKLVHLIGGVLIATVLIRPLAAVDVEALLENLLPDGNEASSFIAQGQDMASQAAAGRIEQALSAYILDKARALGAEVTVQLELSDDLPPVPKTVTIRGSVSPDVIRQLSQVLQQELGIAKEDQRWTG